MSLLDRQYDAGSGGRLALGEDAGEASKEYGHEINEAIINAIGDEVGRLNLSMSFDTKLDYEATEKIWHELLSQNGEWFSEQGS